MKAYVIENPKKEYLHLYTSVDGNDIESYFTTYLYSSEFFETEEEASIFRQYFFEKNERDSLRIREVVVELGTLL